jgi:hypothetical protein
VCRNKIARCCLTCTYVNRGRAWFPAVRRLETSKQGLQPCIVNWRPDAIYAITQTHTQVRAGSWLLCRRNPQTRFHARARMWTRGRTSLQPRCGVICVVSCTTQIPACWIQHGLWQRHMQREREVSNQVMIRLICVVCVVYVYLCINPPASPTCSISRSHPHNPHYVHMLKMAAVWL